ncbi:Acetyl-coenzyme A synthetase [Aliiroseovarius pelagivivens]|uniref:Acetyl-coenzyme A synthetase n=1 Tax=Aliiroseovarius pelagivivens TaxID=1639690 RepID=A0A2R8AJ82_9RHOB|nr:AMP-binding protein [Aliiroseovarius pelagivivens]SPF75927.1 Acetyl-coenzyme A synthetase [Aliiroseovarius pelagivivens]
MSVSDVAWLAHGRARKLVSPWGPWRDMQDGFSWDIPEHFNIAERCCDSWAALDPNRIALTHVRQDGTSEDWSFGRLKEASDRFATVLRDAGLGKGDRIAVLLGQGPEVLITHFAAYKLGAVVLPLFTLFGADALAYRLSDSGAKLVVTDPDNISKLAEIRSDLPTLQAVFSVVPCDGAEDMWRAMDAADPLVDPVDTLSEDPAVMIYTSGTTGPPKGVLHAHRFLLGHLPCVETFNEDFPQAGDKGWTPADWAWIGGLMDLALPFLYYGVPIVSHRMRKFEAELAYRLMAAHNVRNLFMPPTALKLLRQSDAMPEGVDIRSIGSGGESLGAGLLDWADQALGVKINEFYGQTECNLVLSSVAGAMEVKPGSMGQPIPGHEVTLLADDGSSVGPGEMGEICVKAPDPVMFLHYWNLPEKTRDKFHDVDGVKWLRTGDLATRDAAGYFTFASRDDDVITSAGYRIGPSEIENCLMTHPDVTMAAVIGVPDPLRTEAVKAVVVLRDGCARDGMEDALIQLVRNRISPHVAPRSVAFVDHLPMTATGKIMRRELRDG